VELPPAKEETVGQTPGKIDHDTEREFLSEKQIARQLKYLAVEYIVGIIKTETLAEGMCRILVRQCGVLP
jgi:hypothetical protein